MAFSGTSLDEVFSSSNFIDNRIAIPYLGTYLERRIRERSANTTKSEDLEASEPQAYDPVTLDAEKLANRYTTLYQTSRNLEKALTEAKKQYYEYINMVSEYDAISNDFQVKSFAGTDESLVEDLNKWRAVQADVNALKDHIANKHTIKLQAIVSEIREKLDAVAEELNVIRNFIKTGVKELVPSDEIKPNMCIICLDNTISHALVPCGHTLCKECCDKIEEDCPSCRSPMSDVLKIFL